MPERAAIIRAAIIREAPRWVLFCACAAPLVTLIWRIQSDALGPDPALALVRETGLWSLRLLLLTLCLSPLRRLLRRPGVIRYRRMVGLFALSYATLHFLCWMALLLGFDLGALLDELLRRPFIALGFAAWLLLLPLGATSNRAAIRRLGPRWKTLHRAVYLIGVLALAHLWWLSRVAETPLLYTALFLGLMAFRLRRFGSRPR